VGISQTLGKRTLALILIVLITIISVGFLSPFSNIVYAQQQQQQQQAQQQRCTTPPAGLVGWWPGDRTAI
jgi:hypothetical protein